MYKMTVLGLLVTGLLRFNIDYDRVVASDNKSSATHRAVRSNSQNTDSSKSPNNSENTSSTEVTTTAKHDLAPVVSVWPYDAKKARKFQTETSTAINQPIDFTNMLDMKFRLIPPGEFMMGSTESEKDRAKDEGPVHKVRITKPFYIGTYEVTYNQFRQFVNATDYKTDAEKDERGGWGYTGNDSKPFKRDPKFTWKETGFKQEDDSPVVNVSWNDAKAFCDWLSKKESETYRLPTEAEWEYACRAGTSTRFYHGDNDDGLAKTGNVSDAAFLKKFAEWMKINEVDRLKMGNAKHVDNYVFTAPVGQFQPNGFGLYDMQGNVWEWCSDWDSTEYYKNSPTDDPTGPATGKAKIRRGGSWLHSPEFARSARRRRYAPDARNSPIGFRIAATVLKNKVSKSK